MRNRRELVGRVFGTHYEPRVRDNERRVAAANQFRGGPVTPRRADQLPELRL